MHFALVKIISYYLTLIISLNGFKLAAAARSSENPEPLHSTRMILVDRHGQIRGYYDAITADAITKLLADTNHLLKEQPH